MKRSEITRIFRRLVLNCAWTGFAVLALAQSQESNQTRDITLPSDGLFAPTAAPDLRGAQIRYYIESKQWNELLALTQSAAQKDPQDASAFYWEGIAEFHLRKPINAVQAMRTAQKLGLNSAALHEALGLAYYDLNQFLLFEEQMNAAAQENTKDSAPLYYLGLYRLSIREDVSGALKYFREATDLNLSDWKSVYQLGYCLELTGDLEKARASYLSSIQLIEAKGQPYGWPYQGMARLEENIDPKQALEYARKAVAAEPNEASHHYILARALAQTADISSGIKEGRLAASMDPNNAAIRYFLYRLYRRAGDMASADTELKQFQTLNQVYGPQ